MSTYVKGGPKGDGGVKSEERCNILTKQEREEGVQGVSIAEDWVTPFTRQSTQSPTVQALVFTRYFITRSERRRIYCVDVGEGNGHRVTLQVRAKSRPTP